MKSSAIVACVFLAVAFSPPLWAREPLTVANECPSSGPYRACLALKFETPETVGDITIGEAVTYGVAVRAVTVSSRLSGGRAQLRTLIFGGSPGSDSSYDAPFERVPYLGRSTDNHPIVLTDHGPLEVLSPGFDLMRDWPEIIVADERRGKVVARYWGAAANDPVYQVAMDGVRLWSPSGARCISTPNLSPGLLVIKETACQPRNADLVLPAVDLKFERLRKIVPELKDIPLSLDEPLLAEFGGDGLYIRVSRVKGTPYLIISMECGDCT